MNKFIASTALAFAGAAVSAPAPFDPAKPAGAFAGTVSAKNVTVSPGSLTSSVEVDRDRKIATIVTNRFGERVTVKHECSTMINLVRGLDQNNLIIEAFKTAGYNAAMAGISDIVRDRNLTIKTDQSQGVVLDSDKFYMFVEGAARQATEQHLVSVRTAAKICQQSPAI